MQDDDYGSLRNSNEALAYRFIQQCLRVQADFHKARAIASHPVFNWPVLLDVAARERLGPLLFQAQKGHNLFPADVEQKLAAAYDYTARRNLLLLHELSVVLRSLAGAGVEAVLLKGAALAEAVYGNVALRPMGDLDLLVRPQRINEAIQIVTSAGYLLDKATNLAGALEFENQVQLSKAGIEEIGLDLHWNLFDWHYYIKSIPLEWFWQTARPISIHGVNTSILGPEALLLHLCAHAVIDHQVGRGGLLWLVDVKEVICFYEEDLAWDLVLETAVKSSLILPLQRVLPWVAKKLDAPVPEEVLARCRELKASIAEAKAMELRSSRSPAMAQRVLSDLDHIPGWPQRGRYGLRFIGKKLLAPPENLIARYQIQYRFLLPFYYPYWIVSAVGAFIKLAWENRKVSTKKPHNQHH